MAKLFKNSKQILALVMAFAVLAVSLFAGSIVVSAEEGAAAEALCKGTRIEYWDGTNSSDFAKGNGSVENPYIIENAKQLNWVCTAADTGSEGKYYKVDPEIKAFILQPQATVTALGGDSAFMDIASAAATKEFFEVTAANVTLKNWLANNNSKNKVFAGNFDGSGVSIYGCYANDAIAGVQQCALFPILDGNGVGLPDGGGTKTETPTVIKNFALKNSYFKGIRRVAAVASTSWYENGGTKINGFVNAEYIEVANCFVIGQDLQENNMTIHTYNSTNRISEMGIAFGSMGNDSVRVSYSSFYGNDSEYRMYGTAGNTYTIDESLDFDRVFASNTHGNTNDNSGEFHNSIALGAKVNGLDTNDEENEIITVSKVYTDVATTQKGVTVIENGYGPEGQAAMSGEGALDWADTWFMGYYGPTFRAFHGDISLAKTATTHCYACEECGFKSWGGEAEHIYNVANVDDDYICTVCSYQCLHTNQTVNDTYEGDCITPAGVFYHCNDCGRDDIDSIGIDPIGHTLEWVDEIPAECEHEGGKEGRRGYWHCTVCDGNFDANSEAAAKWATMDKSIADPDNDPSLVIELGPHNATNRVNGSIQVYGETNDGHYWICYTCDGYLKAVEANRAFYDEVKLVEHEYEEGVCVDCGWECPEHTFDMEEKEVIVLGDCYTNREEQVECTNCGITKKIITPTGHNIVKVDEVAATDKLEGTKAHYMCDGCKEIYTDAVGTTKAVAAELVIAKVLPKEYQNVVLDNSGKSPNTNDSFASVVAFAAIAGAALVLARKVK